MANERKTDFFIGKYAYLAVVLGGAFVLGISAWLWYAAWNRLDTALPPAGGLPFWVKIEVPHFR